MKILYVINQISDWSGDSGLLWLSVKLMQKRGHDVTIATTDGNPFRDPSSYEKYSQITKKISTSLENPIIINETPIIPVHSISSHFGMYSINAKSIARKTVKFFDLVHIYSWYHHIGIEFFKAAKKYHIPVVFTAMGTLQSDAKNFNKTQKSIIDQLYTKKIIQYASVLHSVGTSEIKSYSQLGGDTKKIIQIENGLDPKDFEITSQSDILKRFDLENKSYILYLGRIHPKKGIELLLDSFKNISINDEIYLVVAGSGEDNYVEKIKKYVTSLGLSDKIKFPGLVSHEEKLTLLKNAKLFSLLSKSDVHPRAVQEALLMGTPVVISHECDYPEIEEYDAGIIVNLDSKQVTNSFEKILCAGNLEKISTNARNLIHEKFLGIDQIMKFENIYLDILSKSMNN
jgi:glycosyltransferase involved in cell wall biosynthesis